ncbi:MAG: HDOD domain-containing protein [Fimbriimonadaceae bacterium]
MSAAPIEQRDHAREILDRVRELAVLPHVVYRVMELSATTESPASVIERAIVVDPGFSSKLLRVANSSYYALPRKVTSIREAIVFLGFKTVREMAMAVGVYDMFIGKTDRESLRRRAWWRHSVDTAVAARYVVQQLRRLDPENAYTCGLLHAIGKTLLDRFGGRDYEVVNVLVQQGKDTAQAERMVYGCDHEVVAVAAAKKWGFPDELIAGLRYLTDPGTDQPHREYGAVVSLSSSIADYAVSGAGEQDDLVGLFPSWPLPVLGISEDRLIELAEGGVRAIAEAAAMSSV